ncbi:MAG: efflux RND transporter periplasmic adaptor subunit [Saprospiraceae bacterium]|nr:efflux RND transporter periplasmic adaptor subunit [Saprospiraceae bacterium]
MSRYLWIGLILVITILSYFLGRFSSKQEAALTKTSESADCADEAKSLVTRYQCGMHTHIHSKEAGPCPICGMKMVALIDEGTAFNPDLIAIRDNDPVRDYIKTMRVGQASDNGSGSVYRGVYGYDESATFLQMAHIPGTLEAMYITHEGQYVKQGQKIGTVYSKEFIAVLEALEFNKKSDAVMRASMNNLREWKVSAATLKSFNMNGDYRKPVDIYADRSGIVTKIHSRSGSHAASHSGATMALYEINESSRGWLRVKYLPNNRFPHRPGSTVKLTINGAKPVVVSGRIISADLPSHIFHGNSEALIEISNPAKKLLVGANYDCTISGTTKTSGIWIPASSILWSGKEAIVYVRDTSYRQPVYQMRTIETSAYQDEGYLVLNGVSAGEEIVVNGAFKLDATARISGKYHRGLQPKPEQPAAMLQE